MTPIQTKISQLKHFFKSEHILPIYINRELISQNVLQNFQFLLLKVFIKHSCQKPFSVFVYFTFSMKYSFLNHKNTKNSFFECCQIVNFTRLISQKVQDTSFRAIRPLRTILQGLESSIVAYVAFFELC